MQDMYDPAKFHDYMGDEKYYHDFLIFFQQEIDKKGWEAVIDEHLFAGNDRTDNLLGRMFAGGICPAS